jgi:phage terminase small subunit
MKTFPTAENRCPIPTQIADDPTAKALWEQLEPLLTANGILTAADVPAFAVLCQVYSQLQGSNGKEFRELVQRFSALARQFGLTPQARHGMGMTIESEAKEDW